MLPTFITRYANPIEETFSKKSKKYVVVKNNRYLLHL